MHKSHTVTTLQALYRVFVVPSLSKPLVKRPVPISNHLKRIPPTTRPFSHSPTYQAKSRPPEQRAQKWNNEIKAPLIYLVDPTTNELSSPQTRYDVLRTVDTKTHRLVQVSPDEPSNPDFIPVCKIISKKETYEADKRRKAQQKEAKKNAIRGSDEGMKTLELNWAIDKNDLGHRLGKIKAFLEEGRRVEVVLASKKGGRKATIEECEGVLKRIREAVEEVKGAKERKDMEGKLGRFATLQFQGRALTAGEGGVGGQKEED